MLLLSSLHSKREPGSFVENEKLAEVEVTLPDGPVVIVVWGGIVSAAETIAGTSANAHNTLANRP
jgi:hypothetical protein